MPISTESMLLKLNPMAGGSGIGEAIQQAQQMSAQRQQMKLARERFEYEKRQAAEEKELRRLEEQGRMAREQMQAERAREQAEAVKQAALVAQQQQRLGEAATLAGSGKVQQAEAMAPLFDQLGINLNNLGSVGGLPVLEFQNRAQLQAEAEQQAALPPGAADESAATSLERMGGIGYPTDERGTLDDTQGSLSTLPENPDMVSLGGQDPELDEATADALMPGEGDYVAGQDNDPASPPPPIADVVVSAGGLGVASLSGQDPFARALASSRQAKLTGEPTRAPDEEDYMGAVPRNRIDLPAMQAQTLARLNPALQARVASLPRELQDAAKQNAAAIGGLGLEATDAIKEMDSAMQDPVSIYNSQQNLLAQKEKDEKASRPSMMDISTFRGRGAERLQKLAEKRGVNNILKAVNSAEVALSVLSDDDPNNDTMIAPALMDAQGVDGVPSNTDLLYSLGMEKASLLTKGLSYVEEKLKGGMSIDQKKAIRKYLEAVQASQKGVVNDYLNNAFDALDSGEFNEYEARGYEGALEESIPARMYNSYWEEREKSGRGRKARGGQSAPAGKAGEELQRQAEAADLNGQVLGKLMGGESGGRTDAANENRTDGGPKSSAKGVFQLTNDTAKLMGFKDSADYAAQPLEKQIEVGIKLFKNKGLTADSPPEDYALVLAAPSKVGKWKSRDEVVYKKGSIEWEGNAPWRPADGGDITIGSIADYYVGKGGAKPEAAAPSKAASEAPSKQTKLEVPADATPEEKRYIELVNKQRGG